MKTRVRKVKQGRYEVLEDGVVIGEVWSSREELFDGSECWFTSVSKRTPPPIYPTRREAVEAVTAAALAMAQEGK